MAETIGGPGARPSADSVKDGKTETPQAPSTPNPTPSTTTPKK